MLSHADVASASAQILLRTKGALGTFWRITSNAKDLIRTPILGPDLLPKIKRSRTTLISITFFFKSPIKHA
jgi:hypothetical protein